MKSKLLFKPLSHRRIWSLLQLLVCLRWTEWTGTREVMVLGTLVCSTSAWSMCCDACGVLVCTPLSLLSGEQGGRPQHRKASEDKKRPLDSEETSIIWEGISVRGKGCHCRFVRFTCLSFICFILQKWQKDISANIFLHQHVSWPWI